MGSGMKTTDQNDLPVQLVFRLDTDIANCTTATASINGGGLKDLFFIPWCTFVRGVRMTTKVCRVQILLQNFA